MTRHSPNPRDPHQLHGSKPEELARLNRARRLGVPLLTWRSGTGGLELLELDGGQRYAIGRRPGMSVVLDDPKVSKLHAELECVGGEWVISDGLSRNGTRVNGELVHQRRRLRDQDRIRVGNSLLAFHEALAELEVETTVPGEATDAVPSFDDTDRDVLRELCRGYVTGDRLLPSKNREIADSLNYGVEMVKRRLGRMYKACGISDLPQDDKRAALAKIALDNGVVSARDFEGEAGPGTG